MATIQKTTLKRYNGTDWDPVYLANSSDITYIGTGFTVDATGAGFTSGATVASTATVLDVITTAVNNLTKVDKVDIPALQAGSTITALAASKLTGIISRTNLPADVSGKGKEVASEAAKAALTGTDVNSGDIVKVTGGSVYVVTAVESDTPSFMELTDAASSVVWSRITGTPTTLAGYGITDELVTADEKVTEAAGNAGKILVLNADGKLDVDVTGDAATLGGEAKAYFATAEALATANEAIGANATDIGELENAIQNLDASAITTGIISIDRLPAAALERCVVVADDTARGALTSDDVQLGDTVKVTATGFMYLVVDTSKLGTGDFEDGFIVYTAGSAASVEWSGVQNAPTTIDGYGITDAVKVGEKVAVANVGNAGKILTISTAGKLDADVTGSAAKLGGELPAFYAKEADMAAAEATILTHTSDIAGITAVIGASATEGLQAAVAANTAKNSTQDTDIAALKTGEAVVALSAAKLTGTVSYDNLPSDIAGAVFTASDVDDMYSKAEEAEYWIGDMIKLTGGAVYVVTDTANLDTAAGYVQIVSATAAQSIAWSQITGVPQSLAAMGWTDAVSTSDVVTEATSANSGKILALNSAGKMDVDITGDAATLGGEAKAYFATQAAMTTVEGRVTANEGSISDLETAITQLDAAAIVSGTISIDRLPHGALERCIVVANDEARFALTTAQAQVGDTVKVTSSNKMYFVTDDTALASEAGYEVYTAGAASSVAWAGVTGTPTTLAGYGITDGVNSSEKVTVASAANEGKILVLNDEGKLDVQITGGVAWAQLTDAPTSTVAQIDAAVEAATHANRAVLDLLSVDADGFLCYDGEALAYKSQVDQIGLGALSVVDTLPSDAAAGQFVLEEI